MRSVRRPSAKPAKQANLGDREVAILRLAGFDARIEYPAGIPVFSPFTQIGGLFFPNIIGASKALQPAVNSSLEKVCPAEMLGLGALASLHYFHRRGRA